MASVRGVGSSQSPVTSQPTEQPTTTGGTQETSQASSTQSATGNPPTQTTPQPQGSQSPQAPVQQQQTGPQRAESQLTGTARQAELQGTTGRAQMTQQDVLNNARHAGLNQAEVQQLQTRLGGMNAQERRSEIRFLQGNVLNSPNADRALRTYISLNNMAHEPAGANGRPPFPSRLTADNIHTLTRGVAERRTNTSQGAEGILGQNQAENAARAITHMPQSEYNRLQGALNNAGMQNGRQVRGSDPQAERALILESVAARREQLSNPGVMDRLRNFAGHPGRSMNDILNYAGDIRGMRRNELIDQSSLLDLRVDGRNNALQQRFTDSCVPTTSQMVRAESDPIYARQLHREAIHTLNSQNSPIANQQSQWLTREGGVADPRTNPQGIGVGLVLNGWQNILNNDVGRFTNQTYAPQGVGNTPQARGAAMDDIASRVSRGEDVPFRAQWQPSGGHALIVSDVRGQGNNQRFLVTDPWDGRTSWISRQDFVNGNTTFIQGPPPSRGNISHYFPGTPQ